jgi:hypothetical protein
MSCANVASAQITVDSAFTESVRQNLQDTGNRVYSVVTEMFHSKPPLDLPIIVFHNNQPITILDTWTKPTAIRIGTTLTDWYIDQFIFQFSHEMGHVMLDPRRNSGFVDAVCTALSLEVLRRIQQNPYRQLYESEVLQEFPRDITLALAEKDWPKVRNYLHDHRSEIEAQSPRYRVAQVLAALSILSGPVEWSALKGIAGCTVPTVAEDPSFRTLPITADCMAKVGDLDCRTGGTCR